MLDLAMVDVKKRLDQARCRHPFVDFFRYLLAGHGNGDALGITAADESGPLTLNAGLLDLDEQGAFMTLDIRYPVTCTSEWLMEQIKARLPAGFEWTMQKDLHPLLVRRIHLWSGN